MLELTALSSVITICIIVYIFRKPIKQFNNEAPEAVSSIMSGAVKGAKHVDDIVIANVLEGSLECARRVKRVQEAMEQEKLPNVQNAYNEIMGINKSAE